MKRGGIRAINPSLSVPSPCIHDSSDTAAFCSTPCSHSPRSCPTLPPADSSSPQSFTPFGTASSSLGSGSSQGACRGGSTGTASASSSGASSLAFPPTTGTFRVLYLFAGAKRRNDIAAELKDIVKNASGMTVTIGEVDLCRGREHDLLDPAVWARVEPSLKSGVYQMVLASPPCNTWSRSTLNPKAGPRPLRSATHLWGFPWLSGSRRRRGQRVDAHNARRS